MHSVDVCVDRNTFRPIRALPNLPPTSFRGVGMMHVHDRFSGRVLLAEDSAGASHLICVYLERAGLEFSLAKNGAEACEKALSALAEGRAYDLILMDMQMPDVDGYEATRRLRAQGWKSPVVAVTAHAMPHDRQRCLDAGCDEYLSKPFTLKQLSACLARYLKRRVDACLSMSAENSQLSAEGFPKASLNDGTREQQAQAAFLRCLREHAAAIEIAQKERNRARLLAETHNLSGDSGLFGYRRISSLARILHELVRQESDLDVAETTVRQLLRLCHAAIRHAETSGPATPELPPTVE